MQPKFVYFDLGNVLALFDHRIAAQNLARISQRNVETVMDQLFVTDLQTRYETGLVTSQQYVREINRTLDCNLSDAAVLEAISDMFQPNWPIIEALELVKQNGIGIGILSNTCEAHWQWLMDRHDWRMLHGWYDRIILSYEVRSMKPDAGIYRACELACGRQAEQIFFTDDRAENIQAARDRSWVTHQYHHSLHASLLAALGAWMAS